MKMLIGCLSFMLIFSGCAKSIVKSANYNVGKMNLVMDIPKGFEVSGGLTSEGGAQISGGMTFMVILESKGNRNKSLPQMRLEAFDLTEQELKILKLEEYVKNSLTSEQGNGTVQSQVTSTALSEGLTAYFAEGTKTVPDPKKSYNHYLRVAAFVKGQKLFKLSYSGEKSKTTKKVKSFEQFAKSIRFQ